MSAEHDELTDTSFDAQDLGPQAKEKRYMPQDRVASLFKACEVAASSGTSFTSGYDVGRAITRMYYYFDVVSGAIAVELFRGMLEWSLSDDYSNGKGCTEEDIAIFETLQDPNHYEGYRGSQGCNISARRLGVALMRLGVDRDELQRGLFWGGGSRLDQMPVSED